MSVESSRMGFFARSVLAALAYGLAYAVLRGINLSSISRINWILMAALRFTCLLFVPIRYWPALVVGEAIPLGYQNYLCLDQFGWAWVLTCSVPPTTYAATIVHLIRKKVLNFEKLVSQKIGSLLFCMFVVSLAVGLHNMLNYSLSTLAPDEQPIPLWMYGTRRVIGNYLTILTITPIVLWLAEGVRQAIVQRRFRLSTFAVLQEASWRVTAVLILAIALLAGIGYALGQAMHVIAVCAMVAALVVAAARNGWQSAALVGAAANIGIVALMPTRDDSLTILAQGVIAALMTFALLLGARTTAVRKFARDLRLAEEYVRLLEQKAAAIREAARQEMFSHERHRMAYATKLEQVFDQTHQEAFRVLHDVRAALPSSTIAKHYRAFDALQQKHGRLTHGLSPPAWMELGGPDGPMVQALERLGAHCTIDLPSPSELTRLSTQFSIALFRLSCEAVAYLVKHAPSDDVRIGMAVHRKEGERPVVELAFESLGRALTVESGAYTPFLLNMGAFGVSEQGLQQRAQFYEGYVEIKRLSEGHMRIQLQVTEPVPTS